MDEILKMSTADKITLLNQIKKDYSPIKRYWPQKKVDWLDHIIIFELSQLGNHLVLDE